MEGPTTIDSLIAAVARTPVASDIAVASALALKRGDVLGASFVVDEEIGRGGMGVVYRATDRTLGREVAIKVMRADRWPSAAQAEVKAIFEREARATARLKHPGIVTAYHAGQDDSGVLFLVLELLHGESLHARSARGALPLDQAIKIIQAVADAVEHAHGHGILHRDLKLQNVYLCDDGRVCLLDFGLAALADAGGDETRSRSGTPSSMAPEQWRGEPQDERTDVWAMGLMLYRMITGAAAPVVDSETELEAWLGAMAFSGVPAAIERVIRRATATAPADRFATARAFLDAIRATRPPPRERTRRVRGGWIAAIIALALAAGGAVAWWLHEPVPAAKPVLSVEGGRVMNAQQTSDGVIVTVDRGLEHGVALGWRGTVLQRGTGKRMNHFTVLKVGARECVGKVKLSLDEITANPQVLLDVPP